MSIIVCYFIVYFRTFHWLRFVREKKNIYFPYRIQMNIMLQSDLLKTKKIDLFLFFVRRPDKETQIMNC